MTNETERTTSTKRQVPVAVGILIALLILGLYLLQITGILDLGLFAYEEEPLPAEGEWIQVHFTTPRYPDDQVDHQGGWKRSWLPTLKRPSRPWMWQPTTLTWSLSVMRWWLSMSGGFRSDL